MKIWEIKPDWFRRTLLIILLPLHLFWFLVGGVLIVFLSLIDYTESIFQYSVNSYYPSIWKGNDPDRMIFRPSSMWGE